MQSWVPADQLRDPPEKPAATEPGANPETPATAKPAPSEGTLLVRPVIVNRAVYRTDALGHVTLAARVNGAQVKFLVDTGASLVGLSPDDAKSAGIDPGQLTFNQSVHPQTARCAPPIPGSARSASTISRSTSAGRGDRKPQTVGAGHELSEPAQGFDMRNGALTMSW